MPIIEIQGMGRVELGDEFLKLSPEQQNATVQEIASSRSPQQEQPQRPSMLQKMAEPITSYPATYQQMNQESRNLMSEGATQAGQGGLGNAAIGAGKVALGGLGYITSPINAALRTVVGKPIEENTGIPKEYSEFAAGMALPIPKALPRIGGSIRAAAPAEADLRMAAQAAYESPEVKAFAAKPEPISNWAAVTKSKLTDMGFDPDSPVFKQLNRLESAPAGSFVTGNNLNNLRQRLGEAAGNPDPSTRKAASIAIKSLDDFLPTISKGDTLRGDAVAAAEKFSEARGNYAALKQSERVTGKQDRADLNASSANSGMNYENNLRQGIKQILNSPAQRRGFSEDVIGQMETFVRGGKINNAARMVGNFLGGGGGLGALVADKALGPVAPMVGFAVKKIGNVVAEHKVDKIAEAIRSESPLGKAIANATHDFGKASFSFEVSQTPKNLARLTIASRNLSNNLRSLGVDQSPDDLLRSGLYPVAPPAEQQRNGSPE